MGVYIGPAASSLLVVHVKIDPNAMITLGCIKTPEAFFKDFVERGDAIIGAVFERGSSAADPNSPLVQLNFQFTHPSDVANARSGLIVDWLDCSTNFIDVTPSTTNGVPTLATSLILGSALWKRSADRPRSCPAH